MRKEGQKREMRINNRIYRVSPEEARIVKLTRSGLNLQEKIGELSTGLDFVKANLIRIASKQRNGRGSCTLNGIIGKSQVIWGQTEKADIEKVENLAPALKAKRFRKFFKRTVSYKPTREAIEFMKTTKDKNLKGLLLGAIEIKEKKPSCKIERIDKDS